MLILTRHFGQALIVDGNIKFVIRGWSKYRGQIEIGIIAPKNVTVHREEIHERIQAEQDRPQVAALERSEA